MKTNWLITAAGAAALAVMGAAYAGNLSPKELDPLVKSGRVLLLDRLMDAALLEHLHHACRRSETVRAAAREADGVHVVDQVLGAQQVGLASAGPATAHVDTTHGAGTGEHDGGAGAPAATGGRGVADDDARHVGDGVGGGHRTTVAT